MSLMACRRVLINVWKEVSYSVTGREVPEIVCVSDVRRLVRRFSQFCKHTQTRERVTIAIATCEIIIRFVKRQRSRYRYAKIENTCDSDL